MKIYISKIGLKLKTFRCFTYSEDPHFLDANQWKKLIKKYLPQLKEFVFHYHEIVESPEYLGERNQFLSSFWIERQWQLEIQMKDNFIIYQIFRYE